MITLKLIGDYPPQDITFLDSKDVPVILLAVICLFIAYYEIKRNKIKKDSEMSSVGESNFNLDNYDILLHPTKSNSDTPPLTNFSLPRISFKEIILWIILIVFYYLIFTEKI